MKIRRYNLTCFVGDDCFLNGEPFKISEKGEWVKHKDIIRYKEDMLWWIDKVLGTSSLKLDEENIGLLNRFRRNIELLN